MTNTGCGDVNYIDPEIGSCAELIYNLIPEEALDDDIARAIYIGIIHDTGVFQYSCTSAKTMEIAGVLMETGIDYPKIVDDTFYTKTFGQNKILGLALLNAELYLDGAVIATVVFQEDMKRFSVLPKHLDGIVNQLRVTKDTKIALFLYENEDGTFKGSLRVNGDTNVADIAAQFGGGGHVKAAGFSIEGPIDTAMERILNVIREKI